VLPPVVPVGALFFLHAFILSSWLTRLPDVLYTLGIDKATLGLALFAAPIGSVVAATFAGRLVDRHGSGRIAIASGIGVAAGIAVIAMAPTWTTLAAALLVFGLINGGIEVAANTAADTVEKASGVHVMARCHGFWSLGFMAGALVAGGFAGLSVPYGVHLPIVGALGVAAYAGLIRLLPAPVWVPPAPKGGPAAEGPVFALPNRHTAGLCLMAVGVTLPEGSLYDWGTLFLREEIGASPFWSSVGYAGFMLAMAVGRFSGDAIRARVPAVTIIRVCAGVSGLGLACFVSAPNFPLAAAALVLMGFGVSLIFPVAISAIATRPGASPANNMAALALAVMVSLLVAPPVIGIVAEGFGLVTAFAAMLPLIAMSLALAGEVAPRTTPKTLSSAGGPA